MKPDSLGRRCAIWASTFALTQGLGWLVGHSLDHFLFMVSHDYVYAPGRFARSAWDFSMICAALTAGFAVIGQRPPLTAKALVRLSLIALVLIAIIGFGLASVRVALFKWGITVPAQPTLVPYGRVVFCEGLWQGTIAGAVLAMMVTLWQIVRERRSAS